MDGLSSLKYESERFVMKRLPFKVAAKTARLFGRENVSNADGAISELVKNTYDADATFCLICFLPRYPSAPDVLQASEFGWLSDRQPKIKNYYVAESVGIAVGFLIAALHQAGLATLTHTPSPMRFLNQILGRPENERPFLILVTGFPNVEAEVPKITKKSLSEITTYH